MASPLPPGSVRLSDGSVVTPTMVDGADNALRIADGKTALDNLDLDGLLDSWEFVAEMTTIDGERGIRHCIESLRELINTARGEAVVPR